MKVIGHRGAGGLAVENTLEAIKLAIDIGVDGVEFDVWTTKDGIPVVHHDQNLARMTGHSALIPKTSYSLISKISNHGGEKIPTAEEAIDLAKDKIIVMEIKDYTLSDGVRRLIQKNKAKDLRVISFSRSVANGLKSISPDLKIYATSSTMQLLTINYAAGARLYGATLNYKYFNRLLYWQASRKELQIGLWTVNDPSQLRLIKSKYPDIELVTTDFPDEAIKLLK